MQPLEGTKIISTAFNMPGPAAVSWLHHWGADVLKIEPPSGDPLSRNCPELYQQLLAKQRPWRLDLKQPAERSQLDSHLAEADLLITSTLPASLARLGLAWEELHERFPRLCQVAIVGHAPPDEEITGHDLTYQAAAGLLSPPAMPPTLWADMAAAQTTISHAMAVLAERTRTGKATISYVAIVDALDFYALPLRHGVTSPGGRLAGTLPNYNIYATREGWLAVAALEPHFWARLQSLLQVTEGSHEQLKAIFLTRTANEWESWAQENRLPLAAVRGVSAER
jgi:alpha-methylacyl-CoA racemase